MTVQNSDCSANVNSSASLRTEYPLACTTWGEEEIESVVKVLESGRHTMGDRVRLFESAVASRFGSKHAIMVNSGSSANLLAVAAQMHRGESPLQKGDEVLVPAVSWATTYFPVSQHGLRLRFVDIDKDTLNLDTSLLEDAITPRTRALLAVNLLGNPNDFDVLRSFCQRHDLILLEDNCESMGATYMSRHTGTFGECSTMSTFFSHHICTMEGGLVLTDDEELAQIVTCLRAHGWTRELPEQNHVFDKTGDPFDDLFRFVLPGYNLRPLEIEAAVGIVQLRKLDNMLAERRKNAALFKEIFANREYVSTQMTTGESSWFGFAMILQEELAGKRAEVVQALTAAGIECRPIVAGNFARNPVVHKLDHSIHGTLDAADKIHKDGFFVGNHHYDISNELELLLDVLDSTAQQAACSSANAASGQNRRIA